MRAQKLSLNLLHLNLHSIAIIILIAIEYL